MAEIYDSKYGQLDNSIKEILGKNIGDYGTNLEELNGKIDNLKSTELKSAELKAKSLKTILEDNSNDAISFKKEYLKLLYGFCVKNGIIATDDSNKCRDFFKTTLLLDENGSKNLKEKPDTSIEKYIKNNDTYNDLFYRFYDKSSLIANGKTYANEKECDYNFISQNSCDPFKGITDTGTDFLNSIYNHDGIKKDLLELQKNWSNFEKLFVSKSGNSSTSDKLELIYETFKDHHIVPGIPHYPGMMNINPYVMQPDIPLGAHLGIQNLKNMKVPKEMYEKKSHNIHPPMNPYMYPYMYGGHPHMLGPLQIFPNGYDIPPKYPGGPPTIVEPIRPRNKTEYSKLNVFEIDDTNNHLIIQKLLIITNITDNKSKLELSELNKVISDYDSKNSDKKISSEFKQVLKILLTFARVSVGLNASLEKMPFVPGPFLMPPPIPHMHYNGDMHAHPFIGPHSHDEKSSRKSSRKSSKKNDDDNRQWIPPPYHLIKPRIFDFDKANDDPGILPFPLAVGLGMYGGHNNKFPELSKPINFISENTRDNLPIFLNRERINGVYEEILEMFPKQLKVDEK